MAINKNPCGDQEFSKTVTMLCSSDSLWDLWLYDKNEHSKYSVDSGFHKGDFYYDVTFYDSELYTEFCLRWM